MQISLAATVLAAAIAASAAGATVVFTQQDADHGVMAAHIQNLTSDIENCRTELVSDFDVTGGHRTQAVAAAELAGCKVSAGTSLSVVVAPGGYDFRINGTTAGAPGYTAAMDTAAGGAIIVTPPAA